MKYQIARDKKKDSDLQSLEDFKAAEKMLRVILWAIAMYLSDYMSGIEGYCSIVQFVRQFNREAEIQMNTRLVQVLLAYMKEIEILRKQIKLCRNVQEVMGIEGNIRKIYISAVCTG